MEIWLVIDQHSPFYSMCDASEETAEYMRNSHLMKLKDLGLTVEEFKDYQRVMDEFLDWQSKLENKFEEYKELSSG